MIWFQWMPIFIWIVFKGREEMIQKDLKAKLEELSIYIGKTITLKNFMNEEKKYTLEKFDSVEFDLLDPLNRPNNNDNVPIGLFSVLLNENHVIRNISYDIIIDAIDNEKVIEFDF